MTEIAIGCCVLIALWHAYLCYRLGYWKGKIAAIDEEDNGGWEDEVRFWRERQREMDSEYAMVLRAPRHREAT